MRLVLQNKDSKAGWIEYRLEQKSEPWRYTTDPTYRYVWNNVESLLSMMSGYDWLKYYDIIDVETGRVVPKEVPVKTKAKKKEEKKQRYCIVRFRNDGDGPDGEEGWYRDEYACNEWVNWEPAIFDDYAEALRILFLLEGKYGNDPSIAFELRFYPVPEDGGGEGSPDEPDDAEGEEDDEDGYGEPEDGEDDIIGVTRVVEVGNYVWNIRQYNCENPAINNLLEYSFETEKEAQDYIQEYYQADTWYAYEPERKKV